MSFWVYILRCGDGSYYTGHTDDLERRLHQHQTGAFGGYTSSKPLSLVYSCPFPSREEALRAERQIKGWSRKKKEAMLRGDWAAVNRLSRGKHKHQRSFDFADATLRTNGGEAVGPERKAQRA